MSYRDSQRLWRSHGDYAASVPAFWNEVERYVQNDPVEEPVGLPGNTTEFDAVGELFYTSYENWFNMRDVMWHQVAPDEERAFAGPPPISVRGERTVYQEAALTQRGSWHREIPNSRLAAEYARPAIGRITKSYPKQARLFGKCRMAAVSSTRWAPWE